MDGTTQLGQTMLSRGSSEYLWIWHRRLGHPSLTYLKHLFPSFRITTMSLECETCVLAKSHKHSYFPSITHSIGPFALIHSDVWRPAVTPRYFSDILTDLLVILLLLFFLEEYIFFIYFVIGLDHEISTFKAIKTILSPNLFP